LSILPFRWTPLRLHGGESLAAKVAIYVTTEVGE
jgi:hypothetical protein